MDLQEALELGTNEIVTFVGGGGKTTCMFRLARELKDSGKKVLVSTTTKIFFPQDDQVDQTLLCADEQELVQMLEREFKHFDLLCAGTGINHQGKITGLSPRIFAHLFFRDWLDYILIEGDGAGGKPFKAPADHEPVIPGESTMVIAVMGADIFGCPLNSSFVHRPEQICRITGALEGSQIDENIILKVMVHPEGMKKGVPPGARWIPLINKVDGKESMTAAGSLGQKLAAAGAPKVILAAAGTGDPVRQIIRGGS